MVIKFFLYFILFLSLIFCLSCKENPKGDLNTTAESKIEIKNQIITEYPRLSTNLFDIQDGIDYSQFLEFKTLEKLIKNLKDHNLDSIETQHLGFIEAKINITIGRYSRAKKILEQLPKNNSLFFQKELLIAIAEDYNLKNGTANSYDYLLSLLETQNSIDCNNYIMVMVLAQKENIHPCSKNESILKQIEEIGKMRLIKEYVLGVIEI